MELKLLLRSGESLLVTFGIPLGILVFFSLVDVLPTGDGDPVEFLVPGVLAISVMSTAFVAQAIQTAFERKYGVLKRLGGTPLTRTRFLTAKAVAVLALVVVQTVLVLVVARLGLGWRPAGGAGPDVALVVGGMLLGTATFTALGLALAGAVRAEATLALTNALYLLLLLVSGLTIDLDSLPAPLAYASLFLPSGALGVLLREGFAPAGAGSWPLATAVLAGWTAVAVAVAVRTFRWEA
ncbi:MAG: ABC transporter permease [Actinobacteria bacterium]|nr:ABC transporter permease [Actinomycetota bacterium]